MCFSLLFFNGYTSTTLSAGMLHPFSHSLGCQVLVMDGSDFNSS